MGFVKNYASVYVGDKGEHRVVLPNGLDLPDIVRTVVVDDVGEPAICVVSLVVNLVGSKKEALEGYGVKTP